MESVTSFGLKKRRSWLQISKDILEMCLDGCKTTKVVYGTNIAFPRFKEYSEYLVEKGLIKREGLFYVTTEKGKLFIELMDEIIGIFEEAE